MNQSPVLKARNCTYDSPIWSPVGFLWSGTSDSFENFNTPVPPQALASNSPSYLIKPISISITILVVVCKNRGWRDMRKNLLIKHYIERTDVRWEWRWDERNSKGLWKYVVGVIYMCGVGNEVAVYRCLRNKPFYLHCSFSKLITLLRLDNSFFHSFGIVFWNPIRVKQ